MTANRTKDVFISYSRTDGREHAAWLRKKLEEVPVAVWQDVISMWNGEKQWPQIYEAIEGVHTMALVITPSALRSQSVRDEWSYARRVGTHVIPVIFDMAIYADMPRWMRKYAGATLDSMDPDHEQNWARLEHNIKNPKPPTPIPFMAPPLPESVTERPDIQEAICDKLVDANGDPIRTRVSLQGIGGFGKTTIAQWVCHSPQIVEAYSDGILWATIGEDGLDTLGKLTAIAAAFGSDPQGFETIEQVVRHIQALLTSRDCLLVLDDVWDVAHIKPFMDLAANISYIITTREPEITASSRADVISVEEMDTEQAVNVLCSWLPPEQVPGSETEEFEALIALANRLGNWPLLLGIFGGTLREEVSRHNVSLLSAISWCNSGLDAQGPVAFDYHNPTDRSKAFNACVQASLRRYDDGEKGRLAELSIFRADEDIPENIAARLWVGTAQMDDFEARKLLRRFAGHFYQMGTNQPGGSEVIHLHDMLREYLATQLIGESRKNAHIAFLSTYPLNDGIWSSVQDDGYLYDHLGFHLQGAERIDDFIRLLTMSPDWMHTKSNLYGSDLSFKRDLDLAYQLSRDPLSKLEVMAAQLVISGRVSSFSDNDLKTLTHLGRKELALQHARSRQDLAARVKGLFAIYAASDWTDIPSVPFLREMARIAEDIEQVGARTEVLAPLIREFADQGLCTDVIELSKKCDSRRSESIWFVTDCLMEEGKYDEAFELANKLPYPYERWRELISQFVVRAEKFSKDGRIEDFVAFANTIEDPMVQVGALSAIAIELAKSDTQRMDLIIEEVTHLLDSNQNYWLAELATMFGKSGNLAYARELCSRPSEPMGRDSARNQVVKELAKVGMIEEARNFSEDFEDFARREESYLEIAIALLNTEQSGEAIQLTLSISDPMLRKSVTGQLVAAWSKSGDAGTILDFISKMDPELQMEKSIIQARITAIVRNGQIAEALTAASALDDDREYDSAHSSIATLLADSGNMGQAIDIASRIRFEYTRDACLRTLAEICNKLSSYDYAQRILDDLFTLRATNYPDYGLPKIPSIVEVCKALCRHGEFSKAIEISNKFKDGTDHNPISVAVVEELCKQGAIDKALEVAGQISAGYTLDQIFSSIAIQQAELRRFKDSQKSLMRIADDYRRSQAQLEIAKIYASRGDAKNAVAVINDLEPYTQLQGLHAIYRILYQTQNRDADRIWQQAISIADATYQYSTLLIKVEMLISENKFSEAESFLDKVSDVDVRERLLEPLVEGLLKAKLFDRALLLLERIKEGETRIKLLATAGKALGIVSDLRSNEYFDTAISAAAKLPTTGMDSARRRVQIYKAIGQALAPVNPKKAIEIFDMAKEAISGTGGPSYRMSEVGSLAKSVAEVGMYDKALEFAGFGGLDSQRVMQVICDALMKTGKTDEALRLARKLENSYARDEVTASIARSVAASQGIEIALQHILPTSIESLIRIIAEWDINLDDSSSQIAYDSMRQIIRIAAWTNSDWQKVNEITDA